MRKRSTLVISRITLIVGLLGLVLLIAQTASAFREALEQGAVPALVFTSVMLGAGPIWMLGGLIGGGLGPLLVPTVVLHLIALACVVWLARAQYRNLRRWGLFAFLVPFLPALLLGVLVWRDERKAPRPAQRVRPTFTPRKATPASKPVSSPAHTVPRSGAQPSAASSPAPGGDAHAKHIQQIAAWCRAAGSQRVRADVHSTWQDKVTHVTSGDGKILQVLPNPADPGMLLIEFDSQLQNLAQKDAVKFGYEVTAVTSTPTQLVVEKGGLHQRVELTVQPAAVEPAPTPQAEPRQEEPSAADRVESNPYFQQGQTLQWQGRYAEAIRMYQQALRQEPNSGLIYQQMGICYIHLGFKAEAKECLDKAAQLDPQFARPEKPVQA